MLRTLLLTFGIALSAPPLCAQLVSTTVTKDLDGDGTEETFTLVDTGLGHADLSIDGSTLGNIYVTDIAWIGDMIGQQPELAITPQDAVQVISMNESVGRDRWKLSLTITFVQGQYLIAGYAYEWSDTRNSRAYGLCEVDLLTGQGLFNRADREARAFQSGQSALEVTLWHAADFVPHENCLK